VPESYEECPEGEIPVDLDYVDPDEGAVTIRDETLKQAVLRAKEAAGQEKDVDASEQIIRIRVHSW